MTYTTVKEECSLKSKENLIFSKNGSSTTSDNINDMIEDVHPEDQEKPTKTETTPTTTSVTNIKDKKDAFKSKYTTTKRRQEQISVVLFFIFLGLSFKKFFTMYFVQNIWIFLVSSVLAMFAADFFSGIVHWAADTWGSLDTPLVGGSFIRSFREHHVMPTEMVNHDFIETNGDNCMLTIPVLAFTALSQTNSENSYDLFLLTFLVKLAFWVSLTNQIHKWSHTYRLPFWVKWLQSSGIILSKRDHAVHHRNPFDKYYCITNGWLNPWLASIGFWKRLEEVITLTTGYIPRDDDQAWTS
ncbi:hypothetical protein DLAC_09573 [Tieghemostelium lacteum]|uniref:Lipid desaturase domain-containing protein n=1 Tax=Tieghemostelium lacteum TaxID=361077 RepID=A0A151Z6M3_TIELA|nr:hypothetical protein DLAC_09573 [Tieghemostelium lacteum]|eukprot:KYQ89613.1 hypothetical protein DLAC_09573 [Tieghemostelium lacteum]